MDLISQSSLIQLTKDHLKIAVLYTYKVLTSRQKAQAKSLSMKIGSRAHSIGLTHNLTNGSNVSLRLPQLSELKSHNSFYIAANPNKTTKAYDFMGYPKRKDIHEGFPKPHDN